MAANWHAPNPPPTSDRMSRRRATSDYDWQEVPPDPDLASDLDYEMDDWTEIETRKNGISHVMFLPEDEEMLKRDAFIVAEKSAVCDVTNNS